MDNKLSPDEALNSPLVSVYIPTHNRSALLKRAVSSVLNQTYKNLEVWVCDDASSDDTLIILQDIRRVDPRVHYISNNKPSGACYSRNRCIELATGEFITGLDDDDEFTNDRIQKFVDMAISKNLNILCSNRYFKNETDVNIGDLYEGTVDIKKISNSNIIGNQVFTRTEYMKELNGFDVNFPAWQDYDMWFRLVCAYGECYRMSVPTYIFYVDQNRPRITTSSRAHTGYKMFISKHEKKLSKSNLKSLYFQDIINRGETLSLHDLFMHFTLRNVSVYTRYKVSKFNFLKKIYYFISGKSNSKFHSS